MILRDVAPAIGMGLTAHLLTICEDYHQFDVCWRRINTHLALWSPDFLGLFVRAKDASELNQMIAFAEAYPTDARMARYRNYIQDQHSGVLHSPISGALQAYNNYVFHECIRCDWTRELEYDRLMNSLVDEFEQRIVHDYLRRVWDSSIRPRKIRWEFNEFTEYIPYAMISRDWTKDDEKSRPYWNSGVAEQLEYQRYIEILQPLLLSLFRTLSLADTEVLFDLFPDCLSVQEFTKTVNVPVEWEKDTILTEGYQKWVGFYEEATEVARPTRMVAHHFSFERPYLQDASEFLNRMDEVNEAIQAHGPAQR